MILNNNFIGIHKKNISMSFLGSDNQENFLANLKKCDNDWYYKNTSISYDINENGHRCKQLKEINLDHYILFTGCSHTTGIGVELEKTYPFIVSKLMGFDYYNLAIPGSGIDVMEYNLLMWFLLITKKPKFVFIQMPDHSRYAKNNIYNSDYFIESGSWTEDYEEQKFLINCQDTGFFNARKFFTYKNIETLIDTPKLMYNVYGQQNENHELKIRQRDLGRDLMHSGVKTNQEFAEKLSKYVTLNHSTIFI